VSASGMFRYLFARDGHPRRGPLPLEWVLYGYMAFTLLLLLFTCTEAVNPQSMFLGRMRILAMTLALWGVYRLLPCRFTMLARHVLQLLLLGWWYPDTYEFNRMFSNLDHLFAQAEQSLFGFQPALAFSEAFSSPFFSELMDLGYVSYYPMIAVITFFYFVYRYAEFERACFIVFVSFFISYVVFIFLPVVGPQFYYQAIGLDQVREGVFPAVGHYFFDHQESLPAVGWTDGVFYKLFLVAEDAGERPTAAFPSSHVSVSLVMLILAFRFHRRLGLVLLPFWLLLCFATVYVRAHYAIDALAGILFGVLQYAVCAFVFDRFCGPKPKRQGR